MTAAEYLQQYGEAVRVAWRLKSEYDKEAEKLDAIRSPQGSDGTPRGGSVSRPTEKQAVRLAEKLTEYEEAELEAIRIKRRVLRTINKIPGPVGAVLYERYINLRPFRQVAEVLHYSERHCYNLRDKGLEEVEALIK